MNRYFSLVVKKGYRRTNLLKTVRRCKFTNWFFHLLDRVHKSRILTGHVVHMASPAIALSKSKKDPENFITLHEPADMLMPLSNSSMIGPSNSMAKLIQYVMAITFSSIPWMFGPTG